MKKGTTRIVFLIGNFVIKMPRFNSWKIFLRGILANIDENMWYKNSPLEWKLKMCPTLFTLAGFLLIAKRAKEITEEDYKNINIDYFKPIPCDFKKQNFGIYNERIVLIDYADSRYFCSDCECIFKNLKK